MIFFVDQRHVSLQLRRMAIASRLSEDQNKLNVILHDRVRFVRLSEKPGPISSDLGDHIRDLAPDDWRQRIKAQFLALHLNIGMKGLDRVTPVFPSCPADITDHNAESTTRREHVEATLPDFSQF